MKYLEIKKQEKNILLNGIELENQYGNILKQKGGKNKMVYALYKKARKIRKVVGNPRSPSNQKEIIVWAEREGDVKSWIRKWGTKKQRIMVRKNNRKGRKK
tara:strand:+ start:246 stop:548 length:303 start_codon:yes stop_codon:yes gene_type:complete